MATWLVHSVSFSGPCYSRASTDTNRKLITKSSHRRLQALFRSLGIVFFVSNWIPQKTRPVEWSTCNSYPFLRVTCTAQNSMIRGQTMLQQKVWIHSHKRPATARAVWVRTMQMRSQCHLDRRSRERASDSEGLKYHLPKIFEPKSIFGIDFN